jgi:hypothetical protein
LLWLIPITRTIFNTTENSLISDLFVDNFPGGVNPQNDALEESDLESNFFFGYNYDLNLNLNLNFISATSALDVGGGSTTLVEADYFRVFTAENPPTGNLAIPFHNFTTSFDTSGNNEQHISFNRRNGDWLATELNTTTGDEEIFNCSFFRENDPISGTSLICTSANYSVDVLNANIIWSLNPSAAGSITVNSSSAITVNRAFGYSGAVTLTAAIDSPTCGAALISKNIHFGNPTGTARVTGDDDLNPSPTDQAFFTVNTMNVNAFNSVTWTIFSHTFPNASQYFNIQTSSGNGTSVVVIAADDTPEGFYTAQARITNACGFLPANKTFYVNEKLPDQIFRSFFVVNPNPSKGNIHIQLKSTSRMPQNQETIQGELYDIYGRLKERVYISNYTAQLNTSRLVSGMYILKIYIDETVENHQVIVQ